MASVSDLIGSLKYQILTPSVTTMGPCSTEGCPEYARGAGRCPLCLCKELDDATGGDHFAVDRLYRALVGAKHAMLEVEQSASAILLETRDNDH